MTETTSSAQSKAGPTVVHYDRRSNESLSVAIATAVAAVLETDVTGLAPLHYTIDTDALDRLFEPRSDGIQRTGSVTFAYQSCSVDVSSEGEVAVERLDAVAGAD